jgi:hypothetical protein
VSDPHDFDLHGIVGVRLVDALPRDVATVRRQLGPIEAPLHREPDITVRFVDEVASAPLTLVGVGDSGFVDDSFFVLRGRGGAQGRALIPLDRVGGSVEIVCERRLPAVPLLLAIVNLTALAKGVLPLHATAFTSGSHGVLVAGWSKGGKTEALLGCMLADARYVGDEWVYLTDDGRMLGVPEPIRVWSWQLAQLPDVRRSRRIGERARLSAWDRLAGLAALGGRAGVPGSSVLRRAAPILERQAYLQLPPAELFGQDRVSLHGRLDVVVLVMSQEADETNSRRADPQEVAERMRASLEEERHPLMTYYRHFRYAFPGRENPLLANAAELEAKLLEAALRDRPCVAISHPYPCDIRSLGETVLAAVASADQPPAEPS